MHGQIAHDTWRDSLPKRVATLDQLSHPVGGNGLVTIQGPIFCLKSQAELQWGFGHFALYIVSLQKGTSRRKDPNGTGDKTVFDLGEGKRTVKTYQNCSELFWSSSQHHLFVRQTPTLSC